MATKEELKSELKEVQDKMVSMIATNEDMEKEIVKLNDFIDRNVPDSMPEEEPVIKIPMVWVHHPISAGLGETPMVYGYTGDTNENGHFVVQVPESCVKVEQNRAGKTLMLMSDYEAYLEAPDEATDVSEAEEADFLEDED